MAKKNPEADEPIDPRLRPYVVVDFLLEQELLFIVVQNFGARPALEVSIKWEPTFRGLNGEQATCELPLFHNLTYLAPGRTIRTLLDTRQAYFQRDEPTRLTARLNYQDEYGQKYRQIIPHNLEIYRDLAEPFV
ncbi:MAG: hypothetical protein ACK2UW_17075 [Anaerolineales bacterium]|jgi:hypothetical protein